MAPPFSEAEFFQVVAAYNAGIWPTQLVLAFLALLGVVLAFRATVVEDRAVTTFLGLLWVWMGVGYHWTYFTGINPAAWLFGALFVVQGLAFLYLAVRVEPLRYLPEWDAFGLLGAALMAYGLVFYPLLGSALGRAYPAQPTFGLPCPTTIFTVGLLLWARPRIPPAILIVPVAWSLVGESAAWLFGVVEDIPLLAAGLVGGAAVLIKNRRGLPESHRVD